MFLTFASIIVFSSIIRFLNRRRQCLSSMNPGEMIRSKKSGLCIVPQICVWLCNLFLGLEMAIGACFGVSPFSFRRRKFSALMEEKEMFGEVENKKRDPQAKCKNGEFKVMTELRNKTLALRDLLDLSPCVGSTSVHDLLVLTLEDLGALYPCAQQFQVSDTEKATLDQILNSFCNAMKSIGEMWTGNDEWMIKSNNGSFNLEIKNSEHHAILMLEDMIKLASERVFDGEEEEEEMVDSPNAFSTLLSEPCSPVTPTSVLPEMFNVPSYRRIGCCSTPIHTPLRVKTARTLSPVGARHLSCHMLPRLSDQDSKVTTNTGNALKNEHDHDDDDDTNWIDGSIITLVPTRIAVDVILRTRKEETPFGLSLGGLELKTSNPISSSANSSSNLKLPKSPPPITHECVESVPPPPQTPNQQETFFPLPLPPPPPQALEISCSLASGPPPPPFPMRSQGMTPPPPPPHPPMASNAPQLPIGKGVSCPPPPSFDAKNMRTKKGSKLKRSSQMGNLYRLLKVKVEGSNLDGKSGRKGKLNSTSGGKQGMADALAEMAKRSTYFQQIEEDVKKHAGEIKETITAITNFQTSDMSELLKFHKYVESHLEKLTDESQVLARFEDFPTKKLEALRMAATLYSKLDGIASTLQQWPKASPVGQLLEKSESYINKIKGDLEKIEQTKDEEEKKYASHKIRFDFSVLVRIKEYMVDVSSNCMELALKEWRDSNAMEKEAAGGGKKGSSGKMLWKAFQFAYRIYTFAGGLDDRADKLTKELAHEIEKEPNP
ncbi:hypothetical protein DM860_001946 [Cuscuta australis]|uniref:Hydroxyproline-rich glycoprotein family protein n=1 Tax=Cuscuta australis TaxID=267555 RepID=A0A328DVD5_9ASTE|nr:hypothetical protein DM860_001946 [Cuscuta australis]